MGRVIELETLDATHALGKDAASKLFPNAVLALFGPLGAGKTSFVQGLAKGLGISSPIQSPTFTYLNTYMEAPIPLYHFDLYRLSKPQDFFSMGFSEYFDAGGISVIEWAEKLEETLPSFALSFRFSYADNGRIVELPWD